MPELFGAPYWSWWLLALLLAATEMVFPLTYLLWLGLAAALTGFLTLAVPGMTAEVQWLVFSALALASVGLTWWWLRRRPLPTGGPVLNRRGQQYIGRVLTLDEPIVNGRGRVRVDDTLWRVEGPDCAAGTRVRVRGIDGTVLRLEPEP